MGSVRGYAFGVGKLVQVLLGWLRPGGGSSLPGWVTLHLDPTFIRRAAMSYHLRIIVTGTNGKTSTIHLLASLMQQAGLKVVWNSQGANLAQGLATALLTGKGDVLLLEVDEAVLRRVVDELDPHLLLVTSLFRDQLDRYGEVSRVRSLIEEAIRHLRQDATLLLNANDPLVTSLARPGQTQFFALEGLPRLEVPGDMPDCPSCGASLVYGERFYAHLGIYTCSQCAFRTPKARFLAQLGPETLSLGTHSFGALPKYLHPYSAAAALATLELLRMRPQEFHWPPPAWGRGEGWNIRGRRVTLALVKNPVSMTWNLAWREAETHVMMINDRFADGRDISWLWDAAFAGKVQRVHASGTRSLELLIRLRYLQPAPEASAYAHPAEALGAALAQTAPGTSVLLLSTYSTLRQAQHLLAKPPECRLLTPMATSPIPPRKVRKGRHLKLLHLYPNHMGTYGDRGNIEVLKRRLEWRGFEVETLCLEPGERPDLHVDLFVLGGGENQAEEKVSRAMRPFRLDFQAAVRDGLVGLLVCGGLQLFGHRFRTAVGEIAGLEALPLMTEAGPQRLVGPILVDSPLTPERLVGFENHSGYTRCFGGEPLGRVVYGHGNLPDGAGGEGIIYQRTVATYLHGPVLARNPWLADRLLAWVLERKGWGMLDPLDDSLERLAAERWRAARLP